MPLVEARPGTSPPSCEAHGRRLGDRAARDDLAPGVLDRGGAAHSRGGAVLGGEAAPELPGEGDGPALDVAEVGLGALDLRGEPAVADAQRRLGLEPGHPRLADTAALALAVEAHPDQELGA